MAYIPGKRRDAAVVRKPYEDPYRVVSKRNLERIERSKARLKQILDTHTDKAERLDAVNKAEKDGTICCTVAEDYKKAAAARKRDMIKDEGDMGFRELLRQRGLRGLLRRMMSRWRK